LFKEEADYCKGIIISKLKKGSEEEGMVKREKWAGRSRGMSSGRSRCTKAV